MRIAALRHSRGKQLLNVIANFKHKQNKKDATFDGCVFFYFERSGATRHFKYFVRFDFPESIHNAL